MEYILDFHSFREKISHLSTNNDKKHEIFIRRENRYINANKEAFLRSKDIKALPRNPFYHENSLTAESGNSTFADLGIEQDVFFEEYGFDRTYNIADPVRTSLEILERNLNIKDLSFLKEVVISEFSQEAFLKLVMKLKDCIHFHKISDLMAYHFGFDWCELLSENTGDNHELVPLWKRELAKLFVQLAHNSSLNNVVFVGKYTLKECYDLPIMVQRLEIYGKKKEIASSMEKFCTLYQVKGEIKEEGESQYGLFELDFDLLKREVTIVETPPYSSSPWGMLGAYHLEIKTIDGTPFLTAKNEIMILIELLNNEVRVLESIYHLCLLVNLKTKYLEIAYPYFYDKGKDFFINIIKNNKNKQIDKEILNSEFETVWAKIEEIAKTEEDNNDDDE